ncbi:endonuclease NucS [Candidatus Bathyarchaeota archaeon]|nr:endonuclease NucS [Candidatus Bathyarchaeota archaeon]
MQEPSPTSRSSFLFLVKPHLKEAKDLLQESFRRRDFVIIFGNCRCHYHGRASSSLGWGERATIVKGDGSVQVHRPVGYEPVNWQPPRCMLSVSLEDSLLCIRAQRPKPRETLEIAYDNLMFVTACKPVDRADFVLYVSEEQMRDALVSRPSMLEDGLEIIDFERKVDPGFIDFYGKDAQGRVVVVELKRKSAGKDAVLQLKRYVDAVNETVGVAVRGIVAAPGLRSGAQGTLAALGLEYRKLTPRACAELLQKRKVKKISEFFEQS